MTKRQSLDSIGPMVTPQGDRSSSPVYGEYTEGKRLLEKQEYSQAALALHNALIGFEQEKDDNGIVNASNQLGHVCLALGKYDQSLKHYHRALTICNNLNDRMSSIAVLKKLVEVYRGLGQLQKVIGVHLEILDHYQGNRDPQGTVATLEELAETYIEIGERSKAVDTYQTISSIHKNFRHDTIAEDFAQKAANLEHSL